jgi:hypothetical protein
VRRDVSRTITLKGIRAGALFTIVYLPRGSLAPAYQWERAVPDRACRLKWTTSADEPAPSV